MTSSQKSLADGYAVERTGGSVRFAPHALSGPGRSARHAALAGIVLGLLVIWFWVSSGLASVLLFGESGFGARTGLWRFWPGAIFVPLILFLFAVVVKLVLQRNVPILADP